MREINVEKLKLKELIEIYGKDNLVFKIKMRPLRIVPMLGILFTTSSDEPIDVEAVISEERYKIKENYKITLKAINEEQFGQKHYYQTDFMNILRDGFAKVFVKN